MKTTLELPESLFRQAKARALHRHITMRAFFNEALSEKLSRESTSHSAWHQSPMPPSPAIARGELAKIHQDLLAETSQMHAEDWK